MLCDNWRRSVEDNYNARKSARRRLTMFLQVNNVNLRGATHNDAAQALKNANGNVNLVLQHRPDGSHSLFLLIYIAIYVTICSSRAQSLLS